MQQNFISKNATSTAASSSQAVHSIETKSVLPITSKSSVSSHPDNQQQTDTAELLLSLGSEFPKQQQSYQTLTKTVRFQNNTISGNSVKVDSSRTVESGVKSRDIKVGGTEHMSNIGSHISVPVSSPHQNIEASNEALVQRPQSIYVPETPRKRGRPQKRQNMLFQEKVLTDADMALHKEAEASRKALEVLRQEMNVDSADTHSVNNIHSIEPVRRVSQGLQHKIQTTVSSVGGRPPARLNTVCVKKPVQQVNYGIKTNQKPLLDVTSKKAFVQEKSIPPVKRIVPAPPPVSVPQPITVAPVLEQVVSEAVGADGNANIIYQMSDGLVADQEVYHIADNTSEDKEQNIVYQVAEDVTDPDVEPSSTDTNIVYQMADAGVSGSVMSQYMEVLKEAGIPTDVPILLDSGDGQYVTVNEEILMNIVNGGVLQCHVTEGNIVSGNRVEFIVQEVEEELQQIVDQPHEGTVSENTVGADMPEIGDEHSENQHVSSNVCENPSLPVLDEDYTPVSHESAVIPSNHLVTEFVEPQETNQLENSLCGRNGSLDEVTSDETSQIVNSLPEIDGEAEVIKIESNICEANQSDTVMLSDQTETKICQGHEMMVESSEQNNETLISADSEIKLEPENDLVTNEAKIVQSMNNPEEFITDSQSYISSSSISHLENEQNTEAQFILQGGHSLKMEDQKSVFVEEVSASGSVYEETQAETFQITDEKHSADEFSSFEAGCTSVASCDNNENKGSVKEFEPETSNLSQEGVQNKNDVHAEVHVLNSDGLMNVSSSHEVLGESSFIIADTSSHQEEMGGSIIKEESHSEMNEEKSTFVEPSNSEVAEETGFSASRKAIKIENAWQEEIEEPHSCQDFVVDSSENRNQDVNIQNKFFENTSKHSGTAQIEECSPVVQSVTWEEQHTICEQSVIKEEIMHQIDSHNDLNVKLDSENAEMSVEQALEAMMGEASESEVDHINDRATLNTAQDDVSECTSTNLSESEHSNRELQLMLTREDETVKVGEADTVMEAEGTVMGSFTLVLSPSKVEIEQADSTLHDTVLQNSQTDDINPGSQTLSIENDGSNELCDPQNSNQYIVVGLNENSCTQNVLEDVKVDPKASLYRRQNLQEIENSIEGDGDEDVDGSKETNVISDSHIEENEAQVYLENESVDLQSASTSVYRKSKGQVISPNKDIPYAVGLLPLRTALEKLQNMTEYQPRKTRSSSTGKEGGSEVPASRLKRKASSSEGGPERKVRATSVVEGESDDTEGQVLEEQETAATWQTLDITMEESREGLHSVAEIVTEPTEV